MAAACVGILSAPALAAYKQEYKLSVVPAATSGWGLSAAYFDDLLKHETGMGTEEYVELKRLDIAREQLSRTGRSVAEIAGGLGYPSAQYFSSLFKKITGLAPNEYRILN